MIKKIAYFVTFLCAILFVNSLYAMYNNNNGKRNYTEEQNQESAKRAKYDDADQSNLNAPIIEQGNDVFVFDKDVTQSLQVNTFAKSLIFKVYPSEDQLTKIGLKFPNVQKIDISDILRDVSSDRKKKFLRELLNFQSLKELICNNNMLTDIELSILPAFTHAPNNDNWLESIHLNQNLITDKGAKNIALMGRKLTELSITHNQIEESGALSIVKMPQLKKLSLDKNLISDESWYNIQKIATEKNLIFIENKEDFFKQTFTDNVVLNNEPKIQQTLIQNFTPVLPLSLQNGPYSIPSENPYYVNNNNNQVVQKQNIKNDTYIFDREAKKTIESYPKGGTIHINTIIFKIIPSSKELNFIRSYYKDVNKIDMSALFGKKFSNIHRIKNDTLRSLFTDLKEFLQLKHKDAYFNQFIKNLYGQEPQKPFNFEKSRLYTEGELFRKKDTCNVFVNALFKESENSNNQIIEKINISFVLSKDKINKIKILAALKIFQNLKELTAEGNELTDEDIICIAQELPRLTLLNVDNNLIGDKGAVSVSQMQNLKKLYVKYNKIKDKGAREIAAMDNLEVFYYDNNEITSLGHRNIQQLREDVLFLNSLSEQN